MPTLLPGFIHPIKLDQAVGILKDQSRKLE